MSADPLLLQRARTAASRGSSVTPFSELQAAVLEPQFEYLSAWHTQRSRAIERLREAIASRSADASSTVGLILNADPDAAFYKLGICMATPAHAVEAIGRATAAGLPLGAGFPARKPTAARQVRAFGRLEHAAAIAASTVLLDGRVLLGDEALLRWTAEMLCRGPNK
jgi:dTDP-4-amino-4,6-dideoxygalactose transaminase